MAVWRLMAYHLENNGPCPIQDWYAAQDDAVKAAFDVTLETLAATEDWTDPDLEEFKVLTGRDVGLGEMRFALDSPRKRRFRPVGIWPPLVEHEFVLLMGCEKSGRIYIPGHAFANALELRRLLLEERRGTVHEYI